jgi:hypothetical protein
MVPTRTERQKASWAHLCDDVLQDPQIQEFLHAMGVKNATQFIRIEDAFLSAPIVVNQGSEERSIILVPTMRNIIIDCKRWWASHPIKEVESWLELTTESLELFQEELFQQDQEANNKTKEAAAALEAANLKSKEAAATLEAVNLKANDELNAAAKRTADEINAAAKRTADALNAAKYKWPTWRLRRLLLSEMRRSRLLTRQQTRLQAICLHLWARLEESKFDWRQQERLLCISSRQMIFHSFQVLL